MRFLWFRSREDLAAAGCLLFLSAVLAAASFAAYSVIHMHHVRPLGRDAPAGRFSEARALDHLRRLSVDIPGRQEGQPGLEEAAMYIKAELEALAERAGPGFRMEVDESLVSGTFNMMFLRHSISLAYRNHKNIAMRISSNSSKDHHPSILVNGHFDSPLGSPGAADCGSCVASMLELARLVVDSSWIPPRPLILLFNGAEELFLLGAHGFVKTHRWTDTVGAFINLEASGTGGLDLVVQSGPGSWPSLLYGQSAKYPMANSAAQDVFVLIPGDTDYRMFAEDYGNIPGLDIIFLLGGYFYHTSYDTMERLFPGSIQARGENLFSLIDAFGSSSMVLNAKQRSLQALANQTKDDRAIFFDYLSLFMVFYSRQASLIIHSLPAFIFLLMPLFLCYPNIAVHSCLATFSNLMKGMLFHAIGVVLGIIIPVVFAVIRLLFSSHAMSWFAHPYLAFLMFVPSSLIGLLIPRTLWGSFQISQDAKFSKMSKEAIYDETRFWGAFGFYAFTTVAYLLAGFGGGFLSCLITVSMIPAWLCFGLTSKYLGHQSLKTLVGYVIPLFPCLTYIVYFGGFLVQFLIEKMGMMGSLPRPYGFFVPDILVAAVVGVVTGWCMGPLIPITGRWLARSSILHCLLQVSVLAWALSSQFFPYSIDAPKRVVLQHTFVTSDASTIVESSYDFSVVDANSLTFIFKNVPEAAKVLNIGSDFDFTADYQSAKCSWVALFPVSFLFSGSLKFPAETDTIFRQYKNMPHLAIREPDSVSETALRRVHLELSLGSLGEIWVTVLNITGPLSNWSFANNRLPAPESIDGGPPSYILRLSGSSDENWKFWLEANSSDAMRVELAVLDQYIVDEVKKLKSLFPNWADITAYSSFMSTYHF
ncbi:endoplasmic reticulum metallopeptidase 1 isoform X1 [Iris pallida]|uniref:Endoplasmic reticulum metallopeptidase 1 isoform X1 n=1 Tax=Iris pallida TaxID=29817 RepID=A0AAX6IGJ8_IRIPA|nr:endoplasmic reticulum metallopeptidase 1 isoform X1 [Iris pallida]